ncbi:inositol monophosphatase family protein [Streptomyces sp. NPDC006527]|uniref:inositol monophosphatase family protein n=1 Tax=Streptomyces sp. NPDC006527 TaxID=3364749 RepID=UPI0036A651AC
MSPNPTRPSDVPAPFASECRTAVAAAEEAGALLRSRFPDGVAARPKGGLGDVVTDLDLMAERIVVDRIRQRYPHDRILAEESGELGGDGGGRTWLVDPLDGSNNVVLGLPVYVVGVALCVDGAPVMGVVHEPVSGRTWSARQGGGAYGPGGRLSPAAGHRPPVPGGPVLAWTQGHAVRRDDLAARTLRTTVELGSRRLLQLWAPLLAWAMLARGDIDGFVGYRAEAIDLPAGALLAREAGMALRHLDGREFGGGFRGPDTERSFVAGRPEALPYLLELVAGAAGTEGPGPVAVPGPGACRRTDAAVPVLRADDGSPTTRPSPSPPAPPPTP